MLELFLLLGSQFIIGINPFKSDENRLTISFWSCFLGVVFLSPISVKMEGKNIATKRTFRYFALLGGLFAASQVKKVKRLEFPTPTSRL